MSSILLVTSSPRDDSLSTKVASAFVDKLTARKPETAVVHRDLGKKPIAHLDTVTTSAIRKQAADRNPEEAAAAAESDELVAELMAVDTVVIATGLINFNIYSTLKSWIDNVARAGMTFRYTAEGPEGLATGTPYLKTVLSFMGMTDVEVVYVEGTAFGPEAFDKALADADAAISRLALAA